MSARVLVTSNTDRFRGRARHDNQVRYDAALPADTAGGMPVHGTSLGEREAQLAALRDLPPRMRAVIVLRYYEDWSDDQIADALDHPDVADVFAIAEGAPVAGISAEQLSAITTSGRRRRRITHVAVAAPLAVVSAGVVVGGVALANSAPNHLSHLAIKPAASSKPASAPAAAAGCDPAGAQHYLVAAEIPANLGDRKDAVPTAAVPMDISWPGATPADPNFVFKIACSSAAPTGGTSVDINGVTGAISHDGSTSTISWSPQAGYEISYSSFGGTTGPVSDPALIAMARAVPTAP